jgi:hypothetical protein
VEVSKLQRPSGDRVKTDLRDARHMGPATAPSPTVLVGGHTRPDPLGLPPGYTLLDEVLARIRALPATS